MPWSRSASWGRATAPAGTEVTFKPSPATFTKTEFDYAILERRLRELAFLNSGLRIQRCATSGTRHRSMSTSCFDGGLVEFVRYLDRSKTPVLSDPVSAAVDAAGGMRVEFALSWNDSFHETMLCYTNNIPQRDGGSHLAGFRQALTRVVSEIRRGHGQEGAWRWWARTCARA